MRPQRHCHVQSLKLSRNLVFLDLMHWFHTSVVRYDLFGKVQIHRLSQALQMIKTPFMKRRFQYKLSLESHSRRGVCRQKERRELFRSVISKDKFFFVLCLTRIQAYSGIKSFMISFIFFISLVFIVCSALFV